MFGLLMVSGIAVWFGFQSFVNLGMTIAIMLPAAWKRSTARRCVTRSRPAAARRRTRFPQYLHRGGQCLGQDGGVTRGRLGASLLAVGLVPAIITTVGCELRTLGSSLLGGN
jgi:hypothetical protein